MTVLISFICNTHLHNKILICWGSSRPVSVVSKQRQRSIGEKEGAHEGGASKGAITKKGRNESCLVKIVEERQRLHIKRRLDVNCFGNCFEELFSFLKRERKRRREPPFIFSCNGFFKLIIKSLGSSFQKIKVFK